MQVFLQKIILLLSFFAKMLTYLNRKKSHEIVKTLETPSAVLSCPEKS